MRTGFNINNTNYVVYKEPPSASPIWRAVVEKQTNLVNSALANIKFESNSGILAKENTIAILDGLFKAEREKELQLLRKLNLDVAVLDDVTFFREFNTLVAGGEHFKAAVERVKYALNNDNVKFAPSQVVHFTSYIVTALKKECENALRRKDKTITIDNLKRATDSAFHKFFSAANKDPAYTYGEEFKALEETYDEIYEDLRENGYINYFLNLHKEQFQKSIEKINKAIEKNSVRGLSTSLKPIWEGQSEDTNTKKYSGKTTIGGDLQEFVITLTVDALNKEGIEVTSQVVENNYATTDALSFFAARGEIDLQKILFNGNTKQEVHDHLEEIYKNFPLSGFSKEDIIMYTNSKMYRVNNDSFRESGFSDGRKRNLNEFITRITDPAYSDVFDNLYQALINTTPGAILENVQIRNYYTNILAQYCARIFFDDWQSGMENTFMEIQGGPTTIHVFNLDDMFFPFSVLISKMMEALQSDSLSDYFILRHFDFKSKIIYPKEVREEIYSKSHDELKKNLVGEMWEEQAEYSYKDYLKASFIINFGKKLIDFVNLV